jgi:sulfatase maturation enzyme AslB (radical SAM superfamily)
VVTQAICLDALSENERVIISAFIQEGLLVPASQPGNLPSILDLRQNYPVEFTWLEVTRQCNMACFFCYESSSPHCYERMNFEDFKLAIKNLIEIGVKKSNLLEVSLPF